MAVIIHQIKQVINDQRWQDLPQENKRVLVKDTLIPYFLSFIYNHSQYRQLVFYGGTCARVIYNLNRLSEDIDLDNSAQIELSNLKKELLEYAQGKLQLRNTSIHTQSGEAGINRWTIKIPLLYELGLSTHKNEKVHLKIETSSHQQLKNTQTTPLIRNSQSFVATHYDLPSLMAGKMIACLDRVFKKSTTKNGQRSKIQVKGRDYYDLIWYMQQGIQPLEKKLIAETTGQLDTKAAFLSLREKVSQIDKKDLAADLTIFFKNQVFIQDWLDNFQDFFERYVKQYLK